MQDVQVIQIISSYMSKGIAKLATFESQKDVRLTYGIRRRRESVRPRNQRDRDHRAAESAQQRKARFNNETESKR